MRSVAEMFTRSVVGTVLAGLYIVIAVAIVAIERRETGGGGWISLKGIASYLVTFPVSFLGERLGMRPDYRRFSDMAFAIGACALLVYLVGWSIEKVFRALVSASQPG